MRPGVKSSKPGLKKSKTVQEDLKQSTKKDFFILPEMFYVSNNLNPKSKSKNSLKSQLSVLTEFGILPGKGLTIYSKNKPRVNVEPSIKLSELMGKRNARMIFKSLDLDTIISSARAENIEEDTVRKLLLSNCPNVLVQFKSCESARLRPNSPVLECRKLMTASGPRNLNRRSKEIEEIDKIFKSCDQLKVENKKILLNLRRISLGKE